MKDFNANLNEVLKYGRLRPMEDWSPMVTPIRQVAAAHSVSKALEMTNHRAILADFMTDADDPREHILRGNTKDGPPFNHRLEDPHTGNDAAAHTALADGTRLRAIILGDKPKINVEQKPHSVQLTWWANEAGPYIPFRANFSAEEARSVLSKFSPEVAPDVDKLIELIDKHFPSKS